MIDRKFIYIAVLIICSFPPVEGKAQVIKLPDHIDDARPRLMTNALNGKHDLKNLLEREVWAQSTYDSIVENVKSYVLRHQKDSTWIVSRLQMYWKEHYTDVYIKNGVYAYGKGKAAVPTVRFTGARDAVTAYSTPALDDIKPYMDEDGKLYLQNKTLPGKPWEWVEQSKTGRIIEAINIGIITKARDAAMIYWYTGDEKYGKFAFDVFNTYLYGIYYRNEPVDLNHGHDQTLVGLSSFEVIHEDVLEPLTACYDFLYGYISQHHAERLPIYSMAFKKWADLIIKNGVPFNNWNLIEARFVADIALVLDDNKHYADVRGCQYYLDQILNQTHTRQWALVDMVKRGYDPHTGIWSECPGYSVGVLGDFMGFVNFFDRTLKIDILPEMPILSKAVIAQAQYLYPNGYIVGFGDTHYGKLPQRAIEDMIRNARLHHKKDQEEIYTRMLKTVMAVQGGAGAEGSKPKGFSSLFSDAPLKLADSIPKGKMSDYQTATFWSPNVSWVVQRNGSDVKNGLMVSQAGSSGNHAHANGIAMELYGKGMILAPESGIGGSYFQTDYAEYYSQFPAHNTVVVDGISSYPAMKSNHPLELKACYPQPGSQGNFTGITYSDVYFLEPETNSDQNRLMSIIRTGDSSGYYVDIFRSKKKMGGDKFHDYIYHNLGQQVTLTDDSGKLLDMTSTEKLTFANTELMGYDYWWDKKSVHTGKDFKARFDLKIPGKAPLVMNMWVKGYAGREVFSVKAPPSRSWRSNEIIPDSIANMPLPTVIIRQNGEAWKRPFAAVYEPSEGVSTIRAINSFHASGTDSAFVGLAVKNQNGLTDYVMAAEGNADMAYRNIVFKGFYSVVRYDKGNKLNYLFLGSGYRLISDGYGIESDKPTSALLKFNGDHFSFYCDGAVVLLLPAVKANGGMLSFKKDGKSFIIKGKKEIRDGKPVYKFKFPVTRFCDVTLS